MSTPPWNSILRFSNLQSDFTIHTSASWFHSFRSSSTCYRCPPPSQVNSSSAEAAEAPPQFSQTSLLRPNSPSSPKNRNIRLHFEETINFHPKYSPLSPIFISISPWQYAQPAIRLWSYFYPKIAWPKLLSFRTTLHFGIISRSHPLLHRW